MLLEGSLLLSVTGFPLNDLYAHLKKLDYHRVAKILDV